MGDSQNKLDKKIEKLGLRRVRRHIFLCCDTGECDCASAQQMIASWKYLKRRLKELGLSRSGGVARSKAQCLDVCCCGPIAVVYPEGAWYARCTEPVLEQIIQQHLLHGQIATEHAFVPGNTNLQAPAAGGPSRGLERST